MVIPWVGIPLADVIKRLEPQPSAKFVEFTTLNDAQRMGFIERLVAEGYGEKVLVAHDICTKHRQVKYGGHGLGHILENIAPRMLQRGMSHQDVDNILTANPARLLAFA